MAKTFFEALLNSNPSVIVRHEAIRNYQQIKDFWIVPKLPGINPKYRRIILCDTGIFQLILDLDTAQLLSDDFKAVNKGALAELFAGLELIKGMSCYDPKQLYYWHRDTKQGNAQII